MRWFSDERKIFYAIFSIDNEVRKCLFHLRSLKICWLKWDGVVTYVTSLLEQKSRHHIIPEASGGTDEMDN